MIDTENGKKYIEYANAKVAERIQMNKEYAEANPYPIEDLKMALSLEEGGGALASFYGLEGKISSQLESNPQLMSAAVAQANSIEPSSGSEKLWNQLRNGARGLSKLSQNLKLADYDPIKEIYSSYDKFANEAALSIGAEGINSKLIDFIEDRENFSNLLSSVDAEVPFSSTELTRLVFLDTAKDRALMDSIETVEESPINQVDESLETEEEEGESPINNEEIPEPVVSTSDVLETPPVLEDSDQIQSVNPDVNVLIEQSPVSDLTDSVEINEPKLEASNLDELDSDLIPNVLDSNTNIFNDSVESFTSTGDTISVLNEVPNTINPTESSEVDLSLIGMLNLGKELTGENSNILEAASTLTGPDSENIIASSGKVINNLDLASEPTNVIGDAISNINNPINTIKETGILNNVLNKSGFDQSLESITRTDNKIMSSILPNQPDLNIPASSSSDQAIVNQPQSTPPVVESPTSQTQSPSAATETPQPVTNNTMPQFGSSIDVSEVVSRLKKLERLLSSPLEVKVVDRNL